MKLFSYGKDGGPESTVWGYWFCEFKSLFSIAILCFENGSREAYHSHAFNSISFLLKGELEETILDVETILDGEIIKHKPSIFPILTYRNTFHKVKSNGRSWVLTFRGPWAKYWHEYIPSELKYIILSDHRQIESEIYNEKTR